MTLTCIKECRTLDEKKTMEFTVGKRYDFTRLKTNHDCPDDWEVEDDNGNTEIFFDPFIMFEQ